MKRKKISCLISLASMMLAVGAFGDTSPIVVLNTGKFVNSDPGVAAAVHSIANFAVPAGTASLDKKLVVTFASESQQPASVSWGGISLTNVAATVTAGNTRRCSVWYADAVPPGTNDVVVTMAAILNIGAINAVAMEGAKPGVALTSVLNDTTGTLITNDVTIAGTNTLLVGMYQNNRRGIFLDYWAGGGGTPISQSNNAGGLAHRGGYRKVALPGVETLAWSNGVSEVSAYAVAGFEEADIVIPEAPPTLTVSVLAKAKFENIAGTATNVFTLPDFGIPAGSDILDKKIVVVFGNKNNSGLDAQSITFGGVTLTNAVSNTGVRKCSVWYLDGVTPGTTNDVVVTMPSASNIGAFNVFLLEGAKPGVTLTAKLDTVVAKTNTVTAIAVKNTLMVGLYQNDNGGTLYDYFNNAGTRYGALKFNSFTYRSGYASVPETGLVTMKFINGVDLSSGAAIAGFEGIDLADIDTTDIIETPQLDTPPTIDGTVNASEWTGSATFKMEWPELGSLPNIGGLNYQAPTHEDLSATVYYAWDATYLYFAIDVTDDVFYGGPNGFPYDHFLWGMDPTSTNTVYDNCFGAELGMDASNVAYVDVTKSDFGNIITANSTFAGTTNAGGWSYEVALKWTDLMNDGGFVPAVSNNFGTHVLLIDNDGNDWSPVDGVPDRETFLYSAGRGSTSVASTPSLWNKILLVEELPAPPLPLNFGQWMAQYSVGGQTALTNDFDGDGMNHLLEYALGGNPETNDVASVMPVAMVDKNGSSNVFAYVYQRWADAAARGLTYTVQRETDLVYTPEGWTTNGIGEMTGPMGTNGLQTVTNTVPADVAARFLRLQVELAE